MASEKGQRLEPRLRDIDKVLGDFDQLRQFIDYKAAIAGVGVVYIDPAYTSQECPICHHISRSNRPTRDEFLLVFAVVSLILLTQ